MLRPYILASLLALSFSCITTQSPINDGRDTELQAQQLHEDQQPQSRPLVALVDQDPIWALKKANSLYSFGLGKRGDYYNGYSFGLGKRGPGNAGVQRQSNSRYGFGLGKRFSDDSIDVNSSDWSDSDQDSDQDLSIAKRLAAISKYNVGRLMAPSDDNGKLAYSKYPKRYPIYEFGLGKRSDVN